jgi:hypothetical protein
MNKEILDLVDRYLESVTRAGNGWTSHDRADYVYWSSPSDREGATSYLVDARGLNDKGLIDIAHGHIELCGPDGTIELPLIFDWKKIRRRVEDALRKSGNTLDLLMIANILNVKLN